METAKFAKDYIKALKSAVPDREFPRYEESWIKHWEDTLIPHGWLLLQKDDAFFNEPRECIPGVNFSEFWPSVKEDDKTTIWRFLQMSVVVSFMDGDPVSKLDKLMDTFKSWWSSSGKESSEIESILEDEKTPGQLKALLDAILETRLVTLLHEVVAELDLAALGIDTEHPEKLIDAIRNPESPLVQSLVEAVNRGIMDRIKTGKFKQEEISRDIERIRAMLHTTFGKVLNEQLFGAPAGGGGGVPASVFMGHGTEARRQRMIARLQKKHRDKMSEGSNKK